VPCKFEILAFWQFDFNDVRGSSFRQLSGEQARNSAVGQKGRWPHSSFRLSPDSFECRGLPSASSPRRALRTQFLLQHPPRSCLRRIAIGLWPEPTAPPRRDVSIQITWRATRGDGWEESRIWVFLSPGALRRRRDRRDWCYHQPSRTRSFCTVTQTLPVSYPLPSRCSSHSFVMPIICDIAERSARWIQTFFPLSRPDDLLNDLLKYQNKEDVFWHSIYDEEYICVSFLIKLEHCYKFRKDLKH